MTAEAWLVAALVGVVLGALMFTTISVDVVMVGALTVLLVTGVVDMKAGLAGMANEGMLTVAVMYVVVAGLRNTGAIQMFSSALIGRPKTVRSALLRIMPPAMGVSAFFNNTPLVAMMIPLISDVCKKSKLPVSKLMIPLSYAAIVGGCCSLIGTSTNLVVAGLVSRYYPDQAIGMFDITWIGLPLAIIAGTYMFIFAPILLPDRRAGISKTDDPRQYTVEMIVDETGPLVGKTIEQAGLRHLDTAYLAEIERPGEILAAVAPTVVLRANDRLVFVGIVDSVVDLQKIRGLLPATDQVFKLDSPRSRRTLIEAVVSNSCPIVGMSIRDSKFRTRYNAVVIAVARDGEKINKKIGDIVIEPGDTLMVEAASSFVEQHRNSRDFYLVSKVDDSTPVRHDKALISIIILLLMIGCMSLNILTPMLAAMLAAGGMLITRCVSGQVARQSVDWQILISIAASFGLGEGIKQSGLDTVIATNMISLAGGNAAITLVIIYALTSAFTELLTNNAAAVLIFPIATATALNLGVDMTPFIMAVMVAASHGFVTPIGYQTNLMVMGPGGYRPSDYMRFGLPISLLMLIFSGLLIPVFYPFHP